ncbi:glutaredoxin [Halomonas sp. PGE1]|uniref:glutaredoxin n=1 Tax=Halomonas sp. PGE1 TaxID=2730360 RepID=UPI0020160CE4|nr:glutaredoxin [Halomonas sp. PGE1]
MFALEWCEFCWSARKLFARLGVEVHSVDLDSVACQAGDIGGRVRPVLAARTGAATIPQIFIGGRLVGGCSELFEAWRNGSLTERLAACGLRVDPEAAFDPDELLPRWLHPRAATA